MKDFFKLTSAKIEGLPNTPEIGSLWKLNNPINRINKPIYEVLYVGDLLIQVQSLGNKDPLDKQLFIIDKFVKKFTPVLPD